MHRLTLPHTFRTSCSNEIKRPFCTRRRVTYATLCARPSKGRKSGNGEWDGEKGREREEERRLETKGQRKRQGRESYTHGERQNELDGARRKHRKRTGKKERGRQREKEISRTHIHARARARTHTQWRRDRPQNTTRGANRSAFERRSSLKLTRLSFPRYCISSLRVSRFRAVYGNFRRKSFEK